MISAVRAKLSGHTWKLEVVGTHVRGYTYTESPLAGTKISSTLVLRVHTPSGGFVVDERDGQTLFFMHKGGP